MKNTINTLVVCSNDDVKKEINKKARMTVLPLITSFLNKYPEELITEEYVTMKFVADLTEVIFVNII